MKRGLLLAIVAVVSSLGLSGPALAHHGDADRYVQEVIDVTGTVVELKMVNPHAHIIFDAEEGGKTVRWQAESGQSGCARGRLTEDPLSDPLSFLFASSRP